jgi:hypothetical protein
MPGDELPPKVSELVDSGDPEGTSAAHLHAIEVWTVLWANRRRRNMPPWRRNSGLTSLWFADEPRMVDSGPKGAHISRNK